MPGSLTSSESDPSPEALRPDPVPCATKARQLLGCGHHEAPEAVYRQLLAAGAADPAIRINLAALCQRGGELAEADQLLRQAIEANPANPLAHHQWLKREHHPCARSPS